MGGELTDEVLSAAASWGAAGDGLGDLRVSSGALALGVAETAAGAGDGSGEAGNLKKFNQQTYPLRVDVV